MTSLINVSNVYKSFKDVKAVQGVNLKILPGQFVALLGPNGAGKTTLVEMIEGIQSPDKGDILIKNKTLKNNKYELYQKMGISLQETRYFDKVRVGETLKLFASFYNQAESKVDEVLQLIKLTQKKKAFVKNLSGGQRQRLSLGLSLLNDPEILLLDEPTTGLDPTARKEIWDILIDYKMNKRTAMILTTHYMEEAAYLCDHIIMMDQGKFLAQGSVDELLEMENLKKVAEIKVEEKIPQELLDPDKSLNICWDPDESKGSVVLNDTGHEISKIFNFLNRQNLTVKEFEYRQPTLDDVFLRMTGKSLSET